MKIPSIFSLFLVLCVMGVGTIAAQETRIVQNIHLNTYLQERLQDADSPLYDPSKDAALFSPGSILGYNLRFSQKESLAQLTMQGQYTTQGEYEGKVLQAWARNNLAEGWSLSFGKKIVKWQDGLFKNPSDIVNSRLAFASKSEAEGRLLAELSGVLPLGEELSLDINAVTPFDPTNTDITDLPLFMSVGTMLYPFEFKFKGGFRQGEVPQAGLSFKASLLDLQWTWDNLVSTKSDVTALKRDDKLLVKSGLGVSGTLPLDKQFAEGLAFAAEYDVRSDGLTKDEGDSLVKKPGFDLFQQYRQYGFLRFSLNNIASEHLDWSETWSLNMEDFSGNLESKIAWSPRNVFTMALSYNWRHGSKESEVSGLGSRHLAELSLSKSF